MYSFKDDEYEDYEETVVAQTLKRLSLPLTHCLMSNSSFLSRLMSHIYS